MANGKLDHPEHQPDPDQPGRPVVRTGDSEPSDAFEMRVKSMLQDDARAAMPEGLCERLFTESARHLQVTGRADIPILRTEDGAGPTGSKQDRLSSPIPADTALPALLPVVNECSNRPGEAQPLILFRRRSAWPVYAAMAAALLAAIGFVMKYGVQSIWNNEGDSAEVSPRLAGNDDTHSESPAPESTESTTVPRGDKAPQAHTIDDVFAAEFNTRAAALWSDMNSGLGGVTSDTDTGWAFTTVASEWQSEAGLLADEADAF